MVERSIAVSLLLFVDTLLPLLLWRFGLMLFVSKLVLNCCFYGRFEFGERRIGVKVDKDD